MNIALGIIALIVIVFIVWRLASNRQSLPCPVWLRWMVEADNPFTKTNRASVIIGYLGLEPGMTVLDAGCGPGRLTIPLARTVGDTGSVTAMDIQPGMLDRVRKKTNDANLTNICYLNAGLGDNRLLYNHFDRALLVTVLGEIPDREKALHELFTALKPGAILSITEVIFDPHFQLQKTVAGLAESTGFTITATWGNSIAYTMHAQKPIEHDYGIQRLP
jgi:ubiquinone/menaquinone biosynthesis C-methylase UbiE